MIHSEFRIFEKGLQRFIQFPIDIIRMIFPQSHGQDAFTIFINMNDDLEYRDGWSKKGF